jgi:large subunit ribosomal protein L19
MNNKVLEFNKAQKIKSIPELQTGDVVKVFRKIKEGEKERIQIFEGIIIAIKGRQSSSPMITVRKVSGEVGVELILPIFSNNIEKIEIVKRARVRRSKLYYLRGVTTKKSRMKYKDLSEFIVQGEPEVAEDAPAEAMESVAEKIETDKKG